MGCRQFGRMVMNKDSFMKIYEKSMTTIDPSSSYGLNLFLYILISGDKSLVVHSS